MKQNLSMTVHAPMRQILSNCPCSHAGFYLGTALEPSPLLSVQQLHPVPTEGGSGKNVQVHAGDVDFGVGGGHRSGAMTAKASVRVS